MIEDMLRMGRAGSVVLGAVMLIVLLFGSTAAADRLTSSHYMINGNLGGSFGGQAASADYTMSAVGGEAIVGNGSSGSYMIDQVPESSASTMQLSVQPSGLAAYYPLDENTGTTTADASSHQHTGTFHTTATWHAAGKLGSAVEVYSGTDMAADGAALVPDNTDLPSGSAMTVEAWVNQNEWQADRALASQWQYTSSGSWVIQTGDNNNLRVMIANAPGDTGSNYVDTAPGTWNSFLSWHHVVVTFDGTQSPTSRVKVYIDGVLASTTMYGTIPATLQDSTGDFSIGSFPGLGRAMNGSIDQVKLFTRALSKDEVGAEYKAQDAGVASGLNLAAPLNGSTTSLVDTIVRTNAPSYALAVTENHDLQSTTASIPAVAGSIAAPVSWVEGTTKGLGFTVLGAPTLESKWGSGANYAAFPTASTLFYTGSGHSGSAPDVVQMRLRLDTASTQEAGTYQNTITYTGTVLP